MENKGYNKSDGSIPFNYSFDPKIWENFGFSSGNLGQKIEKLSKIFNEIITENYNYLNYDIYKNNNEYIIVIDVPGIKKEEIDIDLEEDSIIKISYKRNKIQGEIYTCRDVRYGDFKEKIDVPENADINSLEGTVSDGVLYITMKILNINHNNKKKIIIK